MPGCLIFVVCECAGVCVCVCVCGEGGGGGGGVFVCVCMCTAVSMRAFIVQKPGSFWRKGCHGNRGWGEMLVGWLRDAGKGEREKGGQGWREEEEEEGCSLFF